MHKCLVHPHSPTIIRPPTDEGNANIVKRLHITMEVKLDGAELNVGWTVDWRIYKGEENW